MAGSLSSKIQNFVIRLNLPIIKVSKEVRLVAIKAKRRQIFNIVALGLLLVLLLVSIKAFGGGLEFEDTAGYVERGNAVIIGTVRNNLDEPVTFVKIVGSLYDQEERIIETGFTYTEMDNLYPGERSPFKLRIRDVNDFATYRLEIEFSRGARNGYRDLEILDSRGSYDQRGNFKIIGEVKNTGNREADFVKVVFTGYKRTDDQREIAAVGFTYTDLGTIAPGQKSPFNLRVRSPFKEVTHYVLKVQAS